MPLGIVNKKTCPLCSRMVDRDAAVCSCGYEFDKKKTGDGHAGEHIKLTPSESETCPICKRIVKKGTASCHGCGHDFTKKRKTIADANTADRDYRKIDITKMKTCPMCSRMVEKENDKCNGCGYEFSKSDKGKDKAGASFVPADTATMKTCPMCSRLIDKNLETCTVCGHSFAVKAETPSAKKHASLDTTNKKTCPTCSRLIDMEIGKCPNCGHGFGQKEVAAKTQPKPAVTPEKKPAVAKPEMHKKEPAETAPASTTIPVKPAPVPEHKTRHVPRRKCPMCSRTLKPEADSCHACGFVFARKPTAQPASGGTHAKSPPKAKECPMCGRMMKIDAERCEGCGMYVKKREPDKTAAPMARYEVAYIDANKKLTCPVCNRVQTATATACYGCGFEFRNKIKTAPPKPADVPVVTAETVVRYAQHEQELKKLMEWRKHEVELLKEQIRADERRIAVMKIKLDAKMKIFEDQKKRYEAKINILEKDLDYRKKSLAEQEKKAAESEKKLVNEIITARSDSGQTEAGAVEPAQTNSQTSTSSSESTPTSYPSPSSSPSPSSPTDGQALYAPQSDSGESPDDQENTHLQKQNRQKPLPPPPPGYQSQ